MPLVINHNGQIKRATVSQNQIKLTGFTKMSQLLLTAISLKGLFFIDSFL